MDWTKHHRFQEKPGYCGVTVCQMVLSVGDINKTQDDIAKDIYFPWWGVSRQIMLAYLSQYFGTVNYKDNCHSKDINFHLQKNHIVVVNWWDSEQDGIGDGHYSIVSEYQNRILTMVDSSNQRNGIWKIPYKEFKYKWYDTLTLDNKIWSTGFLLWVDVNSKRIS